MTDLTSLLTELARRGGTDLYVTVGAAPRVSVQGELADLGATACTADDLRMLVQPLVHDLSKFDAHPETDLALQLGDAGRFRVNIFKQRGEYALVARRIHANIPSLDQLALPEPVRRIALANKGLFLVTGPTGSGKSTTLAAMIDCRNAERGGHIVTIEDPIEFLHPHKRSLVSQREVGLDTNSFHEALRSALRQAPHVLSIGEIRDRETAETALTLAETGHLVLATLHSADAGQAVERMLGLFPPETHAHVRLLLSLTLQGVLSQRLIPGTDGKRVLATELMVATARTRDLIQRGDVAQLRDAIAQGGEHGMHSFDQNLFELARAGRIGPDDAVAWADRPNDLRLQLAKENAVAPTAIRFARH